MTISEDFAKVKKTVSLHDFAAGNLEKVGNRGKYACPSCGSGTGPNRTPALSIKGDFFKCFSCGIGGDVFDLAGAVGKTGSKSDQLSMVRSWIERFRPEKPRGATEGREPDAKAKREARRAVATKLKGMEGGLSHPEAAAYLETRGISADAAAKFGMGYDGSRRRVTVPYPGNPWYHIDRDVTGKARAKYTKPKSEVSGPEPLFNPGAVESDHFFVVEGPFDHISLALLGHESMALCGTSWQKTAEYIAESGFAGTVTVALDDDDAGRQAARSMHEFLTKANVKSHLAETPWMGAKDASDLYVGDKAALAEALEGMRDRAEESTAERKSEEYVRALGNLRMVNPLEALRKSMEGNAVKVLPTGMATIDAALGGGLQTGCLYILGAVSSLGKTTLCIQLADMLAERGSDVLYVALEQSASELAAKSISRMMGEEGFDASATDVLRSDRRKAWDDERRACLEGALFRYGESVAGRLRVMEGLESPSVRDIKATAEALAERSGSPPVVFIDYLQLLAPANERLSDKQAADANMRALKHLTRDLNCPVMAISSLNRSSYASAIDLSSWKESGMIEYSADVLIGMQLRNIEAKLHGSGQDPRRKASRLMEQAKARRVREVELVVLKNRSGAVVGSEDAVPLRYDALANTFE